MFVIEEIVSAKFKFADGTESDVSDWVKDLDNEDNNIDNISQEPLTKLKYNANINYTN